MRNWPLTKTSAGPGDDAWSVDLESAESLIAEAAAPENNEAMSAMLVEAALDIVEANWPLISKVADQLCIRRTLSGDELRDLIGR